MSIIVSSIFTKAWAIAKGGFNVTPITANVEFGKSQLFKVTPKQGVKWDIWPEKFGSIDATGKYTAPKKDEPDGAVTGAKVTVRATLKDALGMVSTSEVNLYENFSVKGDTDVKLSTSHKYNIEPEQDGGVAWSIKPAHLGKITKDTGEYTAPKEGESPEAKEGEKVTIIATRNKEPKVIQVMKIELKKGGQGD